MLSKNNALRKQLDLGMKKEKLENNLKQAKVNWEEELKSQREKSIGRKCS